MHRDDRVLIVGPKGDGGIHQYIDHQRTQLREHCTVDVYRSYVVTDVQSVADIIRYLVASLVPILRFPFRKQPTITHVHTSHGLSFYRTAAYVLISAWLWRRPVVVHVHGSSFDEFVEDASLPVRSLQRTVFGAAAAVIVLSEGWADVLAQRTDSEKTHVIPNAVDPSAFDPSTAESPPTVAFVSDLLERKGVPELVEALDRLSARIDRDFRVDIAGRGPLQDDVQSFAAEHEHVHYHGYVSEADKRRLLEEATIFVLPTHAEGLPFALLEAMAGRNAVVTTTVGSIPETLSADHGILVEPGNVGRLTDALETLVTDPETVAEAGRRNRALVRESYAWAAVTEQLLACYDEVLDRSGERTSPARPGGGASIRSDEVKSPGSAK